MFLCIRKIVYALSVEWFQNINMVLIKENFKIFRFWDRTTYLIANAYEYQCDNSSCNVTTFAENVNGFLNYYSCMTERCEDFICTLALETSCEGSARICRSINMKISGDSIIRLLTK